MARQGRLTIHTCAGCKKPQIHVDVERKADTYAPRSEDGQSIPIWRTIRKCRECGTIITGTSVRMIPKEKGGTWERGRKG